MRGCDVRWPGGEVGADRDVVGERPSAWGHTAVRVRAEPRVDVVNVVHVCVAPAASQRHGNEARA
jgi:hypothetical protein